MIGDEYAPYIIAEVNSSHGGKYDNAVMMIDAAKRIGCDCVKFQSWSAQSLYASSYYKENRIAKRIVQSLSLTPEELRSLSEYSRGLGLGFSSTPYSNEEVDFLASECGAPFIKIASMELNNDKFLKYIAQTQKPLILSTGMGTRDEVDHAVNVLKQAGNTELCLLHCISIYPCKPDEVHLNNILWLREEYPECVIGFSDHSLGTDLAPAAVALGARVIEKHLTLDRKKIGMDNQMATEPDEFEELVRRCNTVFAALGSKERTVSEAEKAQRLKMRRSLVYAQALPSGHVITEDDLVAKRPGTGLPPNGAGSVIGWTLKTDVEAETLVRLEDLG